MRRGVVTAANLLQTQAGILGRFWCAFATLTYAEGVAWKSWHISMFSDCVRKYLERRGVPYRRVWVMELTRAGRPHYHVMVWLPRGVKLPKLDQAGWWPHGMTRIEKARNPVGYLAKYASKGVDAARDTGATGASSRFPKGARIFGHGGFSTTSRAGYRWWMLPRYVRERCPQGERAVRVPPSWVYVEGVRCRYPGGGWVIVSTGEYVPPRILQDPGRHESAEAWQERAARPERAD